MKVGPENVLFDNSTSFCDFRRSKNYGAFLIEYIILSGQMNNESRHQKACAILDVIAYFFVERELSCY